MKRTISKFLVFTLTAGILLSIPYISLAAGSPKAKLPAAISSPKISSPAITANKPSTVSSPAVTTNKPITSQNTVVTITLPGNAGSNIASWAARFMGQKPAAGSNSGSGQPAAPSTDKPASATSQLIQNKPADPLPEAMRPLSPLKTGSKNIFEAVALDLQKPECADIVRFIPVKTEIRPAATFVNDPTVATYFDPNVQLMLCQYVIKFLGGDSDGAFRVLARFQSTLNYIDAQSSFRLDKGFAALFRDMLEKYRTNQLSCDRFNAYLNPLLLNLDLILCSGITDTYALIKEHPEMGRACNAYDQTHQNRLMSGLAAYNAQTGMMEVQNLACDKDDCKDVIVKGKHQQSCTKKCRSVWEPFWERVPEPVNMGVCCTLSELMKDNFICQKGLKCADTTTGPQGSPADWLAQQTGKGTPQDPLKSGAGNARPQNSFSQPLGAQSSPGKIPPDGTEGIFKLDPRTGQYVDITKNFVNPFGVYGTEIAGTNCRAGGRDNRGTAGVVGGIKPGMCMLYAGLSAHQSGNSLLSCLFTYGLPSERNIQMPRQGPPKLRDVNCLVGDPEEEHYGDGSEWGGGGSEKGGTDKGQTNGSTPTNDAYSQSKSDRNNSEKIDTTSGDGAIFKQIVEHLVVTITSLDPAIREFFECFGFSMENVLDLVSQVAVSFMNASRTTTNMGKIDPKGLSSTDGLTKEYGRGLGIPMAVFFNEGNITDAAIVAEEFLHYFLAAMYFSLTKQDVDDNHARIGNFASDFGRTYGRNKEKNPESNDIGSCSAMSERELAFFKCAKTDSVYQSTKMPSPSVYDPSEQQSTGGAGPCSGFSPGAAMMVECKGIIDCPENNPNCCSGISINGVMGDITIKNPVYDPSPVWGAPSRR